jgi:hypothetical protein
MREPVPPVPTFEAPLSVLTERARRFAGKMRVPTLEHAHPLIVKILAIDAERVRRYATEPYRWNRPAHEAPLTWCRLRILNALFLALRRCGCPPWVRGHETLDTGVRVGDENLSLKLEPLQGQSGKRERAKKPQAGVRLHLEIGWSENGPDIPVCSQDTGERTLQQQISEIVPGLLAAGEMHYAPASFVGTTGESKESANWRKRTVGQPANRPSASELSKQGQSIGATQRAGCTPALS